MLLEEPASRERRATACQEFDSLTKVHVRALHSVAHGILASDDLAWDAVQESLLCLWKESQLPPDVRGWLLRTVVHKSLHVARSHQRATFHEERARRDRPEPCPLCDPLIELENRELSARLDRAIEALSEEMRAVFVLRQSDGLDYGEIARALRVPIGTVRSRLNRVREHLAARLDLEESVAKAELAAGGRESSP